MADEKHEKVYTPKQVTVAVLEKVGEILQKSELNKKYYGFKAVEESARKSGASDPAAVAAAAGRKKYGKKAFQEAAAHGHKIGKGESEGHFSTMPDKGMKPGALGKKENPDKEADAELGEKVEHDVEEHMLDNKDAERKEGHKIMKCDTCGGMHKSEEAELAVDLEILSIILDQESPLSKDENWNSPSPSTGQGEFLRRTKTQEKWMEKGETKHDRCVEHVEENSPGVTNPHAVCVAEGVRPGKWKKSELEKHGLSPEQMKAKLAKHGLSPEEIKSKLKKYETSNSKKLGYKLSEAGKEERSPEASDQSFKVQGKDQKTSSGEKRLAEQKDPMHNSKEQAEGNNEPAGTTPTQVGQDGKNKPGYDEMKGHLKLAKFIGRMEHKRTSKAAPPAQASAEAQHKESIKDKP